MEILENKKKEQALCLKSNQSIAISGCEALTYKTMKTSSSPGELTLHNRHPN